MPNVISTADAGSRTINGIETRQVLTFKDPRYAFNLFHGSKSFGLGTPLSNYPKTKFNYFVSFNLNPSLNFLFDDIFGRDYKLNENGLGADGLSFHAQSVTQHSIKVDAEKINQYNKWRMFTKKINYEPITVTFMDTMDERLFRFLKGWLKYYVEDFKYTSSDDASNWNNDTYQAENRGDGWGVKKTPLKYLISNIDIYHLNPGGASELGAAGFTRIQLVNPLITNLQLDSLEYASSDPQKHQVTFDYEGIIWHNTNETMNDNVIKRGSLDEHGMQPYRPITQNRTIEPYATGSDTNINRSNNAQRLIRSREAARNAEQRPRVYDPLSGGVIEGGNSAVAAARQSLSTSAGGTSVQPNISRTINSRSISAQNFLGSTLPDPINRRFQSSTRFA